jgi:hypothetical protein
MSVCSIVQGSPDMLRMALKRLQPVSDHGAVSRVPVVGHLVDEA